MVSPTENIDTTPESSIPTARFFIGEDVEEAPITVKRPRLSESESQSRQPVQQSKARGATEGNFETDGLVEDLESDSEGHEESESDEELETEEEVEVRENVGIDYDAGDNREPEPVSEGQNQQEPVTISTAASSLRGLSDVAVPHRTGWSGSTASPVCNNANGELQAVLTDSDVLDCPICLEPLCIPVFQCENGHIACSSCCYKVKNKCASCSMPIGYNRCRAIEKVIESIKVSCKYALYGCKETMTYSKKSQHEQICPNAPCFCPHPSCPFTSSSRNIYLHFGIVHSASTIHFFFGTTFYVHVATHLKQIFLQERCEKVIFILNHQVKEHGRVLNVDCVGPRTLKGSFEYEITARSKESTLFMKCVPEIYAKWSEHLLKKNYLTVPSDFFGHNGTLTLKLCIKKLVLPV